MKKLNSHLLLSVFLLCMASLFLSGCLFKMGDMESVKKGKELAIACKTDEALKAFDLAEQSGGIGAAVADLEREIILRDAGRIKEAEAVMQKRNQSSGADPKTLADSEKAVLQGVEDLRAEREKRTGKATCN